MDVLARIDQARRACNVLDTRSTSAGPRRAERRGAGLLRGRVPPRGRRLGRCLRSVPPPRRTLSIERASSATPPRSAPTWRCGTSSPPPPPPGRGLQDAARASPWARPSGAHGRGPRARTRSSTWRCSMRSRRASRRSPRRSSRGSTERYGYSPEGPAVEYFRLHATLDVEHARQARELIEELMSRDEAQDDGRRRPRPSAWSRGRPPRCGAIGSCSTASKRVLTGRLNSRGLPACARLRFEGAPESR